MLSADLSAASKRRWASASGYCSLAVSLLMTVLPYPRGQSYAPVGHCIYCGVNAENSALQREHIIPYGLNGTLTLPAASCAKCSAVTGQIESFCLQQMFVDVRTHLGLASRSHRRNKKQRPMPRIGLVDLNGKTRRWLEIAIDQHPFALATLALPEAGMLCDRPVNTPIMVQFQLIPSAAFIERFADLPANRALHYTVNHIFLGRLLAKIAHGFATAEYGAGAFDPLLPEVILGRSSDIFHLVGGELHLEQQGDDCFHKLVVTTRGDLVTTYIRLFAFMDAPAYRIVVGRRR